MTLDKKSWKWPLKCMWSTAWECILLSPELAIWSYVAQLVQEMLAKLYLDWNMTLSQLLVSDIKFFTICTQMTNLSCQKWPFSMCRYVHEFFHHLGERTKCVILDCSAMPEIDYTVVQVWTTELVHNAQIYSQARDNYLVVLVYLF